MDPEEKRKELELAILSVIEEKLRNGEMDEERARTIAKMVLEKLHPPLTLEQIYTIAPTLDDSFKELTAAVLPLIREHDEKVSSLVSSHIENLLHSGNIEEAVAVLKQHKQDTTS